MRGLHSAMKLGNLVSYAQISRGKLCFILNGEQSAPAQRHTNIRYNHHSICSKLNST